MERLLNLKDIHASTGIAMQRLRYVLDQGLLPGANAPSWRRGRGSPRVFTAFEAFGIACAALLLKAGLRRRAVKECISITCAFQKGRRDLSKVPLYRAFEERSAAYLEVGDGDFVRLVGSEDHLRHRLLFGWVSISTGTSAEGYEPLVTIRVDIARLRRLIGACDAL